MKICHDQECNDIGVVIATKWRHCLFYLQQYFSALGTVLTKSFMEAFCSNSRLDVREVKTETVRVLLGYFGMKFYRSKYGKKGKSWCLAVIELRTSQPLLHFQTHCWCYLPYTVLRAEMILERYAEVYSNQFTTGKSPFQSVQCSTVLNNEKTINM